MITVVKNSTGYRQHQENIQILGYIHGGEGATVLGAWDVVAAFSSKETMDKFMSSYKLGK